ncbi:MAG: DEAD/DEAH box helicase [Sulfolobales archaeon]|nr:DEAD/DEAH box helicase [Ignisphaera sp.]MCX8199741.1 DEAD/DEAH box helicase [Sulfolobales archaeon]MDW8085022.1 DEAD/DEAH box helicase [Ignisphaera sp.]
MISNADIELPQIMARGLRDRGIVDFKPPQLEALQNGLLNGYSIVVSAPTASGKTLIGEMALVNAVLKGFKGIYTSPLKALAYEKFNEFKSWEKYGIRITISTGDYEVTDEELARLENYDIIVSTYERLDSIMRRNPVWLKKVGTLVIDELHMIGDENRGHIVEMIAIRAKMMGVQIVGLSATIGNSEELARWLGAKLVRSEWRPVKLYEFVTYYLGSSKGWVIHIPSDFMEMDIPNTVGDITEYWILRAAKEGFNVLEFKYSRKAVEELAAKYSHVLCENLSSNDREQLNLLVTKLRESVNDFEYEGLSSLIKCGAAYHHAGLTPEARKFVEEAFRERLIKYVAATPTLAMGVNLPARVVIINTKFFNGRTVTRIPILEYKQLAGRAGRPQYDPYGIVIVAKDSRTQNEALYYVKGNPEPVHSVLWNGEALRRHLLAVIASGEANTLHKLISFFSNSFASLKIGRSVIESKIERTLTLLEELTMISSEGVGKKLTFIPSKLGIVTSRLYVDPITSYIIVDGLTHAKRISEIYYLTLVGMTPDFSEVSINKSVYEYYSNFIDSYDSYEEIPPENLEFKMNDPKVDRLRGFIVGSILRDWISEVPEREILQRYGIEAGDLRVVKENGEWLTYAASIIARTVNMHNHSEYLKLLNERLKHGIREDALDLVKLRYVGRVRARMLLNHGIRTIRDIVDREGDVIKILGENWGKKIVEEARSLTYKT